MKALKSQFWKQAITDLKILKLRVEILSIRKLIYLAMARLNRKTDTVQNYDNIAPIVPTGSYETNLHDCPDDLSAPERQRDVITHESTPENEQYKAAPEGTPSGSQADEGSGVGEAQLIMAVQHLLSLSGVVFSRGAIRDLPDVMGKSFDLKAAISALRHVGFQASLGELAPCQLQASYCPAIGFLTTGEPVVLQSIDADELVTLRHFHFETNSSTEEQIDLTDLAGRLAPYILLARKFHSSVIQKGKNDWFWGSLAQSKALYVQVIIAAALTNVLGLSTSLFIMVVYDRVVPNEAIESLIALTIGVLIALGFDFIIKSLRSHFVDRAGRYADRRMSRMIFDQILMLKRDGDRQRSGSMASIVREFDTLRDFFTSATLIAVVDIPFIFFLIWIIHLISGPLVYVPLTAVPLVILSGLAIQPFLERLSKSSMQSGMSKQGILVETINGLGTIQATGSGQLMRRRFEEASEAQSDLGLRTRMLSQLLVNSAASIQQFAQIATVFWGVFLIQDGVITMGSMIAAVMLGGRCLAPLSQLASAMSRANGARQAYQAISTLMHHTDGGKIAGQTRLSRPHLRGVIELKNVSYAFCNATGPIIRNQSLRIQEGQKIAIVGRMGSGKTTLARLLAGLIEPSEGAVLIDGVDMRQIDKSDLVRNIGVMLQETWLFSGSVKENLQMGFHEYDEAHILKIAKVSGVDAFVASHQQGYDLELREHGAGLSGGQRQSISLARAMLHNPNVLILDEPTSAMDSATEKLVTEQLYDWAVDKTVIMITHRKALWEVADRVLIMDRGMIIADTTPQKLRAQAVQQGDENV